MGIGSHVDHQLARDALALLADGRRWVMPAPTTPARSCSTRTSPTRGGRTSGGSRTCQAGTLDALPGGISLTAEFADISDRVEREDPVDRVARARSSGCSTARRRWPRPSADTRPARPTSAGCRRPRQRCWVTTPALVVPPLTGPVPRRLRVTTYDRRARGAPSIVPAIALVLAAALLFVAGIAIRLWVLPARGLSGDVDQFVVWIHGIATGGWANAYEQNLSFPAVMAWIWGLMALVQPAFATVVDAADPAISAFMKVPASVADLGIALAVGWWFRDRAWASLASMAAVLLWPVTWYVSAWWGQYESIYVLPAVLAVLAARADRPGLVAVLVTVSLMTKPQAVPFLVPFGAWYLATQGLLGTLRGVLIAAVTAFVLWLPFLAAGGPLDYLANVQTYQNDIFSVLSLRAWNPWWALPGGRGRRRVRARRDAGPRAAHVPPPRPGPRGRPLARRVRPGLPRPDGPPTRAGARGHLAGRVRLPHDDARALRLPAFVFLLMGATGRGWSRSGSRSRSRSRPISWSRCRRRSS